MFSFCSLHATPPTRDKAFGSSIRFNAPEPHPVDELASLCRVCSDLRRNPIQRAAGLPSTPGGLNERRKRLDALGAQYPLPPDVRVEPVDANGVAAEWTTPEADPTHVTMFLHGGAYISDRPI